MKNNAATFIHIITNRIYKILPLMESEAGGADMHIDKYVESIVLSMKGAIRVFDELDGDKDYLSVLCSVGGLLDDDVDFTSAKREILRCLKTLNMIEDRIGGVKND